MKKACLTILAISLLASISALAQRRVNPVNNASTVTQSINENKERGDSIDRSKLVEMTDSRGNKILVDTVTGKEFVDTFSKPERAIPKMQFPLLHSMSFSVDFFQGVMRAFGQHYGLVEFAAELNLHNRYIPVVEIGLGQAKNKPDDNNYTYRSPIAPFFRVGANYNFLYNSNPDYMLYAGARFGFSPFKFSVTDVTTNNGYWDEDNRFDIPSQSVTASFFEFLLGLRVKIHKAFSLGWTVRYRSVLHQSKTDYGEAWYIPGYGAKTASLGATFSLTYTIPFKSKASKQASTGPEPQAMPDAPTPDGDTAGAPAAAPQSTPSDTE